MKPTTDMEIKFTGGGIIGADVSADGACKLTVEMEVKDKQKPKDVPSEASAEIAQAEDEKKKPNKSFSEICAEAEAARAAQLYRDTHEEFEDFDLGHTC